MAIGAAIAATAAKVFAAATLKKIAMHIVVAVATGFVAKRLGLFKPPKIGQERDPGVKIQLPPSTDNKIPVFYGRNIAGGIITHAELVNQNQTMRYVFVLSEFVPGATYTVNRVFRNDVQLTVDTNGIVTGGVTRDGDPVTDIANKMRVYVYANGTAAQNQVFPVTQTPAAATARTGELTANTSMEGLVYLIFEINYDPEASLFDSGIISVDLENNVVNPADVLIDYLTNNRYGAGLAGGALDMPSFDNFRAYCDETVSRQDPSGTAITAPRWRINGGLSTFNTALENIQEIVSSSSAWFTYNPALGKYTVKINAQATQGEKDNALVFDDDNIVSKVDVSTTELYSLYNEVEAEYEDVNLLDQTNVVYVKTPGNQRKPGEPDNTLRVRYSMVNDLPRARNLANIELRQSRFDKIVRFTSDYSGIELLSGDLFRVSNPSVGFEGKLFRCLRTLEVEDESGRLLVEITGMEYDDTIYDHSTEREVNPAAGPGIPIFINNPDLGNIRANAIANIVVPGFQIGQIPPSVIDGLEQEFVDLNEELANAANSINDLNTVIIPNLEGNLSLLENELANLDLELDGLFPITETQIANDSITTPKIFTNAVTADKLAANSVTANAILARTITALQIETGTITSLEIAGNTITANNIVFGNITGDRIAANTITANLMNVQTLNSITSSTGTLFVDTIKTADSNTDQRTEITGIQDDSTYALWSGANAKTDANAGFFVKHTGDAKFAGRVRAAQLEGAVLDAVPISVDGITVTNNSNVSWATVGDRYVEIPETIRRPRKPFVSVAVPVFGIGSQGAFVRVQMAIQDDNGNYGSFFTVGSTVGNTLSTDPLGSSAPLSIGAQVTGNRGFRFRVQFKPFFNGQNAQTSRYDGIFIALPAGSGFIVRQDSTNNAIETVNPNPNLLIPPDFQTGWQIP